MMIQIIGNLKFENKIIGADRMIFDIFWRMFPGYTFDSIEQAYNIIIEKLEKDKLQK